MSALIDANSVSAPIADFLTAVAKVVGQNNVLTSDGDRKLYSTDFSEIELATAAAVVRPRSTEEVVAIVKVAQIHGVSLIPRGGGMSYTLTYVPVRPDIVMLDMTALNRILEINVADLRITVETGVTWKQINEALRPTGFRIPFLGTFSGERATVGGGLGNNATGHGALDITDYLLGIEIVLPDGRMLQTGARVHDRERPIIRGYGPDLTGLFTHDAGAFGIKTKASFRLVRRPKGTAYRAFGFRDETRLVEAMCEITRLGIATEVLAFGEYHHRVFASQPKPPPAEAKAFMRSVLRDASSPIRGLRRLGTVARGMHFLLEWPYSLTLVVDNVSQRGAEDGAREIDRLAKRLGGTPIRPTLGIALRAQPFMPIGTLMVGLDGASSFPSNYTLPLSGAQDLVAATRAFFAENAEGMSKHGVYTAALYLCFKGAFGFEPIIFWPDRLNVLRYETALSSLRKTYGGQAANPEARAYAIDLRKRLMVRLEPLHPAHYQTGKYYPYRAAISGHSGWDVLADFKRQLDPEGRINPGALGL